MEKRKRIVFDDERLKVLCDNKPEVFIEWKDVYVVSFYKIDTMTCILTYLVFDFEYGEFIELHDGMEGFNLLVENLSRYLPIQYPDWESTIKSSSPIDSSVTVYRRLN